MDVCINWCRLDFGRVSSGGSGEHLNNVCSDREDVTK